MESVPASDTSEGRPCQASDQDGEVLTDEESTNNRSRLAHTSTNSNREQFIAEQELMLIRLEKLRGKLLKPLLGYGVILIFLSTETFRTYLQPPGGLDESGQMHSDVAISIYTIFSSLSFYTSLSALVLCIGCSLPRRLKMPLKAGGHALKAHRALTQEKHTEVTLILMKFVGVNCMLVLSLCFCVGAYVATGFVVAPTQSSNRLQVLITAIVGGWMFLTCVLSLLQDALNYLRKEGETRVEQIFSIIIAMVLGLLCSLPFTGLFISYLGGFCQSLCPNLEARFSETYLSLCFGFWKDLVDELTTIRPCVPPSKRELVFQNPTFQ